MRLSRHLVARSASVIAIASATIAGTAGIGVADAPPTGPVGLIPATTTPHFPASTPTKEQIRQIVKCGDTMYAVGTFTTIVSGTKKITRTGAFSFSAAAPYTVSAWDPEVNGTVNSITFNNGNCADAYIVGTFTAVGATAVKNIAEVDTTTGAVVTAFKSNAAGEVDTILAVNGHLLTGGKFTAINGSSASPYFTSLDPTTGKNDGYLNLAISGNYVYNDADGKPAGANPTRVWNQQLSNSGTRLLVEGDFTSIGGQARRQVAMLDLGPTAATTDAWHATELDANCSVSAPFYAQDASWSPDDSVVYIASTGGSPATGLAHTPFFPRSGLCDSAAAFPSTAGNVTHTWINYTGCDSLYATVTDGSTAYFAGHERWASNPFGCDKKGLGAVVAPGIVGLSPANGAVTVNPTRARGEGADDLVVTPEGLWIASDNLDGANMCGGVTGLAGLCLLPYTH